jgi:hypothetical protein
MLLKIQALIMVVVASASVGFWTLALGTPTSQTNAQIHFKEIYALSGTHSIFVKEVSKEVIQDETR